MTIESSTWVATKTIAKQQQKKLKAKGWKVRIIKGGGGGYIVNFWK